MVYRTIGQSGYAAYAAVTSAVAVLSALNLGIGGSLVTPVAQAAAFGDKRKEAELFRAGVMPLAVICLVALLIMLPAVTMVPLTWLLGEVARANVGHLRSALVVACVATLASLPVSIVGNLRQAYQEMHITNLVGAAGGFVLCVALVAAARAGAGLPVFVACFAGIPVAASLLNGGFLLAGRRYLLSGWREYDVRQSVALTGDGVRFLAASFTSVLLYQWPVYLMARNRPTVESAAFAVSMQLILLPISFIFGVLQPFWGATAEAAARGDLGWVKKQTNRVKWGGAAIALAVGTVIAVWGERLILVWLGRKVEFGWSLRLFAGAYLLLATWEYLHFVLSLGAGRIREASTMVFARSAVFAAVAPLLVSWGGGAAAWLGLGCSVASYTAWRLPRLLAGTLSRVSR